MFSLLNNVVNTVGSAVSSSHGSMSQGHRGLIPSPLDVVGAIGSNIVSKVGQVVETALDIFTLPDKVILELIYATHVHDHDENFDVESMFFVVENVIKQSIYKVDTIIQGVNIQIELQERHPKAGFTSPLNILKAISRQLSSEPSGQHLHESTLEILGKISKYSWHAKAVLTLGAFGLEHGEFWSLAQPRDHNQSKSIAILKRIPIHMEPEYLHRRKQVVVEISNLIKATFEVIEILVELDKFTGYDPKDVPGLAEVMDEIPVNVYWIIISIIACSTKINLVTNDEERPLDLTPYAQKINYILNKLKTKHITFKKQIDDAHSYRKIWKLFQTPTEILEIFKGLLFPIDNVTHIFDGHTRQTVTIEILRKKHLFLFFTTLDITDEDIDILRPVYEETKKHNQYHIVWIPIVEHWTDELKKKFEMLCSQMPWYVVQYFSPIWGINFIKVEWNFKGKPILVHLNHQGKVENPNALHLIRVWGIKAFPFTKAIEDHISKDKISIDHFIHTIDPIIPTWIKEERYIFFYGGKNLNWVQNIAKKLAAIANDSIIKESRISIEIFCVGKSPTGVEKLDIVNRFWTGIESLFLAKIDKPIDPITQEIQKLLSYKNEDGWVLLTKGPNVIFSGHGLPILKVVEDFEIWREYVKDSGFEVTFIEHYNKVAPTVHYCSYLDIPSTAVKVPGTMKCPECPRVMETYITYQCCHVDGPTKAHH